MLMCACYCVCACARLLQLLILFSSFLSWLSVASFVFAATAFSSFSCNPFSPACRCFPFALFSFFELSSFWSILCVCLCAGERQRGDSTHEDWEGRDDGRGMREWRWCWGDEEEEDTRMSGKREGEEWKILLTCVIFFSFAKDERKKSFFLSLFQPDPFTSSQVNGNSTMCKE